MSQTQNLLKNKTQQETNQQTFAEHLGSLRRHILIIVVALTLLTIVGYIISPLLQDILVRPLPSSELVYTGPLGGLQFKLSISILFALIVSIPISIAVLFNFARPALSTKSFRMFSVIWFYSVALALAGLLIAYNFAIPSALQFLAGFENNQIESLITTDKYLNFLGFYLVGFALIMEIPLVIVIACQVFKLDWRMLVKHYRVIVVASFVLSALITPTVDLINQVLMASVILAVYSIGVAAVAMRRY